MIRLAALLVFLLLPVAIRATSLENVHYAQALLGTDVWSRVILVENVGRNSVYPRTLYALVFELGGLLWFYTDTDGTQSISLHQNNLLEEKANFTPLLLQIDPGFVQHHVLPDDRATAKSPKRRELPNGCFIESFATLREGVSRGELIRQARLMSYYSQVGRQRLGHTVLVYETPAGTFMFDSLVPNKTRRITAALAGTTDPLSEEALPLARTLNPEISIVQARWVPTPMPRSPALMAKVDTPSATRWAEGERATTVQ